MIVVLILEVNRLPIYRKIDPSKVRQDETDDGGGSGFGTTAYPVRDEERRTGD